MENLLNSCRKYFHPIGNIIPVGFLENSTGFQKYLEEIISIIALKAQATDVIIFFAYKIN